MIKNFFLITVLVIIFFSNIIYPRDNTSPRQKSDLKTTIGVIIKINVKANTITVKDYESKIIIFKVNKSILGNIKINNSKVRIIYEKSNDDFVVLRLKELDK